MCKDGLPWDRMNSVGIRKGDDKMANLDYFVLRMSETGLLW